MKPFWIVVISCCLSSCFPQEDQYIPLDPKTLSLFPVLYQTGDTIRFELAGWSQTDTQRFVVEERDSYLTTGDRFGDNGYSNYYEVQRLRLKNIDDDADIVMRLGAFDKPNWRGNEGPQVLEIRFYTSGNAAIELESMQHTVDTVRYSKKNSPMHFDLDYSLYSGIVRLKDYSLNVTLTQLP